MKRFLLLLLSVCVGGGLFGQEIQPDEELDFLGQDGEGEYSDYEDLFADLFSDAEDVLVENQEPANPISTTQTPKTEPATNLFYKPLTFSGHMEAEVGVASEFTSEERNAAGFLLFKNDLSLTARASKNLAIHGTINVKYPNFALTVDKLYFDYLLLDKVYISGGKKSSSWGYVQLLNEMAFFDFNFHSVLQNEHKYIPTNIMSDSGEMLSFQVQVPVWTGTITGVLLYPIGRTATPQFKDFTYAGSIEMTVWKTAVNFFGRKNPSDDSDLSKDGKYKPPVLGLELKRTILGFDVYGQTVVGIQSLKELKSLAGYESVTSTGGFYRVWDGIIPKIGFNVEFQHVFTPHGERAHTYRTAFLGGLSSMGPKKNIKVGVEWNHLYVVNEGDLSLGLTVSDILPHANWKVGLDMAYGENYRPIPKFTLGTSIVLLMDY